MDINTQLNMKNKLELRKLIKSFLICIPMMLISLLVLTELNFKDAYMTISYLGVWIFVNCLFFLMIYTGKTDKYRAALFITSAIGFSISFICDLYALRGDLMVLTDEQIASCSVPFCHIVIPQTIIPLILKKEIIFPGAFSGFKYTIPGMIMMWFVITLALGRGWCSWMCFYGGWDDGCSRCRKTPNIKWMPKKLLLLPSAVLIASVLISAATLSPQYCWWLCPFKAVTEFKEVSNITIIAQTVIFAVLFLGLAIILPMLTKKRTQCSLLCPFGAMQSLTNKISPFEIRIDTGKCINCKKCINSCSMYALDENVLKEGRTRITCSKCGKCADTCPVKAVNYHIKGTKFNVNKNTARILFLYIAFIVLIAVGGGFIADALHRILILFSTGRFI